MKYDFDTIIPRSGTNCRKWDSLQKYFGNENLLSFWIADTDFAPPPAVISALRQKVSQSIYGYPSPPERLLSMASNWYKKRYNWHIEPDNITLSPGIVFAISLAIQALTAPDDEIIIQPPIYPPFFSCVAENKRIPLLNTLINTDGYYTIDFNQLEQLASRPNCKLLLLCNPHNPVGRAWQQNELSAIADICLRHNLIILSDEIHADLTYDGLRHHPVAQSRPDASAITITLNAPSKTFNIAGLYTSFIISQSPELNQKICNYRSALDVPIGNIFGLAACEAAYEHGEDWLDQLLIYLSKNADLLCSALNSQTPIKIHKPQATFLAWLDCRQLLSRISDLNEFFCQQAGIALSSGISFGDAGHGFMRFNFGCPQSVLRAGIKRIITAVNKL